MLNLPRQTVPKKVSIQSGVGSIFLRAIDAIDRNMQSINKFFEVYDVYDGRIFDLWELSDIVDNRINKNDLIQICEENQKTQRLLNNTVSYEFLYGMISTAPDCPEKFRNQSIKPQPYSIYSETSDRLSPQCLELIQDILQHDQIIAGNVAQCYDEIFTDQQTRQLIRDVDGQTLAKMIARSNVSQRYDQRSCDELVDFIAVRRGLQHFTKTQFVAAMHHMTIKLKPDIARHFKDDMPGMDKYRSPNEHLLPEHLRKNNTWQNNQMASSSQIMQPPNNMFASQVMGGPGSQSVVGPMNPNHPMGFGAHRGSIMTNVDPQVPGMSLGGGLHTPLTLALESITMAKNLVQSTQPGQFDNMKVMQIMGFVDTGLQQLQTMQYNQGGQDQSIANS